MFLLFAQADWFLREMAVGNTFGATALSSYGGFWITFGIVLTPGGFQIVDALGGPESARFLDSFGLLLMGWFIFTFLLLLATLRSTVAFFLLFFTLDMAFLLLGIGYLQRVDGAPNPPVIKAGGVFGLLAAFLAWYNALAGILDDSNRYVALQYRNRPSQTDAYICTVSSSFPSPTSPGASRAERRLLPRARRQCKTTAVGAFLLEARCNQKGAIRTTCSGSSLARARNRFSTSSLIALKID